MKDREICKNTICISTLVMLLALFLGITTISVAQGQTEISLTLGPLEASNPVGTTHTVVAKAIYNGIPMTDKLVVFSIFSGPNSPFNGTGTTDAAGEATFTYTDYGGAGTDKIQAILTINEGGSGETIVSNIVTKEWVFVTTGFMTGKGELFEKDGMGTASTAILSSLQFQRVTYRFKLHCDKNKGKNILEINLGNSRRLHLEEGSTNCYFIPTGDTNPPKLTFNVIEISGIITDGEGLGDTDLPYMAEATFADTVKPGKKDIASIVIKDRNGLTLLEMSGEGHHKVHKDDGIVLLE